MATHRGFRRKGYGGEKASDGRGRRVTEYGEQLREKQNLKAEYGLLEKSFKRYVREAQRRKGVAADMLLQLLECRLDNVVFRAGFASTRNQARQLVSHRHILVNGRIVNIGSFSVRAGDVIEIKEKSRSMQPIAQAIANAGSGSRSDWLQVDTEKAQATVTALPDGAKIVVGADMKRVMEFYSR